MSQAENSTGDRPSTRRALVEKAIADWRKQLFDFSGRNRLLYFRDLKAGTLTLTDADAKSLDRLLFDSKSEVRISELFPPTVEVPRRSEDALRRAQTIHKKARELYEERGLATLHAAVGLATWRSTASSGISPSAPVLLRPLTLQAAGAAENDFVVSADGEWRVNEVLIHFLRREFWVEIDSDALREAVEQVSDVESLLQLVRWSINEPAAGVEGFGVEATTVLATFSYTKLPMVLDLELHVDELVEHDVIAALAGDAEARASLNAVRVDASPSAPDFLPPADEYLVLDADSSQNRAINSVLDGESMIIEGPPGTGKSQTIANLIASSMARGKRVLFVAEKRAAIEAVMKRLESVGLKDLVFDLHGGIHSRREMAIQLGASIDRIAKVAPVPKLPEHQALAKRRKELREHVDSLHELRTPWNVSLLEVEHQLLGLPADTTSTVRLSGDRLRVITDDRRHTIRDLLAEWTALSAKLDAGSPWCGAKVETEAEAETARQLVQDVSSELEQTRRRLDEVLARTGLPRPASIDGWQAVLGLLTAIEKLLGEADPAIYEQAADLAGALERRSRRRSSRFAGQLVDRSYRQAKKVTRSLIRSRPRNVNQLYQFVLSAKSQVADWAKHGGTGSPRLPEALADTVSCYDALVQRLAALSAFFVANNLSGLGELELRPKVDALASDQPILFLLPRLHALRSELDAAGLRGLMGEIDADCIPASDVGDVFDFVWLQSIRSEITARDPRLSQFNGTLLHQRAAEYRSVDIRHRDSTPRRVGRAVAEAALDACNEFADQRTLVQAEARKKIRHLQLRELCSRAPDLLTSLRPCWTMSPLLVAETLPPRPMFDLVIFDEASQVLPADAVSALLRGKQAVVAGDRRQLPPTTFFDSASTDDEDGEDGEIEGGELALTKGFESILDALAPLLRSQTLEWHYRSEDERLIAFSNRHLYGGQLTTFPGAASADCIEHVLVPHRPGVVVDTKSSDEEVAKVVDLMIDHARQHPAATLGAIAMGIHHANRIEASLRSRLAELRDPALDQFFDEGREERAFVKNLERVQGDERDAIILSVGYGKNADGVLRHHFGPINQVGGERRLNVAVTRARQKLTLVSSISHTDFQLDRSNAKGFRLLHEYLRYGESGGRDLGEGISSEPLNPFELDVMDRLEREGLQLIPQYGASGFRIDFAVKHPDRQGEFVLAVEADGASYHSIPTTRDRDRLRQQVLEARGWVFHRIWSTDWFNDPVAETERAVNAYREALAEADRRRLDGYVMAEAKPRASASPELKAGSPRRRKGMKPRFLPGLSITAYDHDLLVDLVDWISSDGMLRTDDQLMSEMMQHLGFKKRGTRIREALELAIAERTT